MSLKLVRSLRTQPAVVVQTSLRGGVRSRVLTSEPPASNLAMTAAGPDKPDVKCGVCLKPVRIGAE